MEKAGVVALVVVGLVLGVAAFAFAFGTPQAPLPPAGSAPVAQAPAPAAASVPDAPIAIEPSEEKAPFAVQIPGCRCHSDDPAVVEEHSQYRINECRSCHSDGSVKMGSQ